MERRPLLFETSQCLLGATGGSKSSQAILPLLLFIGLLIVAAVVGGLIVMRVRRRTLADSEPNRAGTFESLRRMVRSGAMTQEEFDAVRRRMAERLKGDGGESASGRERGSPPGKPGG